MVDEFANPPLPIETVPLLDEVDFVPVDPRYRQVRIGTLVGGAIAILVATVVLATLVPRPVIPVSIGIAVLLIVLAALVVTSLEFRRLAYQLREHDVSLRSGAITHRVETIPFTRVQHVTVHRGPVDRLVGLASLEVSSAGPDLTIPGLTTDDAARMKQLITDRAGVDDEDEDDRAP